MKFYPKALMLVALPITFAIILVICATYEAFISFKVKQSGIKITGIVDSIHFNDGSKFYDIGFKTPKDDSMKISNRFTTYFDHRYKRGDSVTILYLENDPTNARIDSFEEIYMGFIIYIIFAVISCLIARLIYNTFF
jgi:hypothetical protein